MWWKSNFYEGSVGVPLIFSWPGHFPVGQRSGAVVSLLDVGPTLIDLAQAEPLPDVRGRSFSGFLSQGDGPTDWPNEVFSECCGLQGDPPARPIRLGAWKLIHYHGYATPQLFNVEEDPSEMQDRTNDPACRDICEELHARVLAGWSGDRIVRTLERRDRARSLVRQWSQKVQSPDLEWNDAADRWTAPAGCNVFPE